MNNQNIDDALLEMWSIFEHIPGDVTGNKLKTKIIKQCPDIREKLNAVQNIVLYADNGRLYDAWKRREVTP